MLHAVSWEEGSHPDAIANPDTDGPNPAGPDWFRAVPPTHVTNAA